MSDQPQQRAKTRLELIEDVAGAVVECAGQLRLMTMANNGAAAVQWAEALSEAASAYNLLRDEDDD